MAYLSVPKIFRHLTFLHLSSPFIVDNCSHISNLSFASTYFHDNFYSSCWGAEFRVVVFAACIYLFEIEPLYCFQLFFLQNEFCFIYGLAVDVYESDLVITEHFSVKFFFVCYAEVSDKFQFFGFCLDSQFFVQFA